MRNRVRALPIVPDLLGRPRKEHGSGWCAHILDREVRAWHELHSRKLLNGRCAIGKVILMQRRYWGKRNVSSFECAEVSKLPPRRLGRVRSPRALHTHLA